MTDAAKLENIPVNASLEEITNPKITTDIKTAVTNLTNQLVQQQKSDCKQGTSTLTDLINKTKNW
jgi:hypothetical protein